MTELNNYTLNEFYNQDSELIQEYMEYLKHLEPVDTKHRIIDLKLNEVEFIKQNLSNDDAIPEIIEYVQEVKQEEVGEMKIVEFFGYFHSIREQIETITRMEQEHLISNHVDIRWEAVEGSKKLSVLGILPTVDNLAQGDILKYDAILDLPYLTVFNKLRLDTLKGDLEREMSKVKVKQD